MEIKEYNQRYSGINLCGECIHLFLNNGENGYGCRAFPEGIPQDVQHGKNHLSVIPGQRGNYVYKKAAYEELSPLAKHLHDLKHKLK